jgi:hypothetical protein
LTGRGGNELGGWMREGGKRGLRLRLGLRNGTALHGMVWHGKDALGSWAGLG